MHAYYQNTISAFTQENSDTILGILSANHLHRSLEDTQKNAWRRQIAILQNALSEITGHIYFEFSIPRMGRRVDNILLIGQHIFVVEFKIGSDYFDQQAINQVVDYSLDLRNFHSGSHNKRLHLATSVRSFRSEKLSAFIHHVLDNQLNEAKSLYQSIKADYPLVITRDLMTAKKWLNEQARGSERFGLVASSGGRRLKAYGLHVKNEINVTHWFLNNHDDVRASYSLEDIATEFDVQGLELDWICIAWDGNFYYHNDKWHYQTFKGNKWQNIHQPSAQNYLKNAYRVLLTRARQGMVIWLPKSSEHDVSRPATFYEGTYQFLKEIGIEEISL